MSTDVERSLPSGGVAVSDAIEMLRAELDRALDLGAGKRVQFNVPEITVVLTVVATTEAEGHAGVRWWVIDAGGSATWSDQQTQTLTLTLRPTMTTPGGTTSDLRVKAKDSESNDAESLRTPSGP